MIVSDIPEEIRLVIDQQLHFVNPVGGLSSSMAGGENGPYFDIESPIRNTAHWLITYSILYEQTRETKYKNAAHSLLSFLLTTKKFNVNGVYIHRQKGGKDWSNGVIGQSWVIEALMVAGTILKLPEATERAKQAANMFSFDQQVKAWNRIDSANGKNAIDYTLNHQLWFAAAKIEADFSCKDEVDAFLTYLNKGAFQIREKGLICHILYASSLKGKLLKWRYRYIEKRNKSSVIEKEVGYHLFNLYPLARLYHHLPDHEFFQSSKFIRALNYCISSEFRQALDENKYAYPYNSPAFEFPIVLKTFKKLFFHFSNDELLSIEEFFMRKQIAFTYDNKANLLALNCPDSLTLSARIYEYIFGQYYEHFLNLKHE